MNQVRAETPSFVQISDNNTRKHRSPVRTNTGLCYFAFRTGARGMEIILQKAFSYPDSIATA